MRLASSSRVSTMSRTSTPKILEPPSAIRAGAVWNRARLPTADPIRRTRLSNETRSGPAASSVRSPSSIPASTQILAVFSTETGCTSYAPSPGTRKSGVRRRIHAMLLIRMSSAPNTSVGRTIA